jgi:hypothetical protein
MRFLVFTDCTPDGLESNAPLSGLNAVLGEHSVSPNMPGPDGQTGLIVSWPHPTFGPRCHFDAAAQTWRPSFAKREDGRPWYWVGIWTDAPPAENELRRNYTQSGPLVKLGEHKWKLTTPDTVDARAVYADDGSMRWETVRQYAWVCDEATALRDTYLEEFGVREFVFRADPTAQIGWLMKLLQINYRMLPEVADTLGLWVGKDYLMDVFLTTLGLSRRGDSDA